MPVMAISARSSWIGYSSKVTIPSQSVTTSWALLTLGETESLAPAAEYRKVETIMNDLAGRRMLIYPFGGFFRKGAN